MEEKVTPEDNALYDRAVGLMLREGRTSTSFLQRNLGIDYRAAYALVKRMERQGIISGANSEGKRTLLLRTDQPPEIPKLDFKSRPGLQKSPRTKRSGRLSRFVWLVIRAVVGSPTGVETATYQRARESAYVPDAATRARIEAEIQAIVGGPGSSPKRQENPYELDEATRARIQAELNDVIAGPQGRRARPNQPRPKHEYELDDETNELIRAEIEELCADPPKKIRHKPQKVRRSTRVSPAPAAPKKSFGFFAKPEEKSISHVSDRNGTFTVYDDKGRIIRTISTSPKAYLVGYTNKTFSIKFADTVTVHHVSGRIISQRSGG